MNNSFKSTCEARFKFLDIHYHANPDSYLRRYSAMEIGHIYEALGGGVVLKNHLGGCSQMAEAPRACGLPVFGSLVLNHIAGGLSLQAVQQELCFRDCNASGRLIVHLPTQVPHKHKSALQRARSNSHVSLFGMQPEPICTPDGHLRSEVHELFEFAETAPIVISSGHASRSEIDLLMNLAASRAKPVRLMLNQPANPMTGMTAEDLIGLGEHEWLFIEQTALTVLLGYQTEKDFFKVLLKVPNLIYSSDLGQTSQMTPPDWLNWSQHQFDEARLSKERRKEIQLTTPLDMLDC